MYGILNIPTSALTLSTSASLSIVKASINSATKASTKQAMATILTPFSSPSSSSVADNCPVERGADPAPGKLGALGELGCNFTVACEGADAQMQPELDSKEQF